MKSGPAKIILLSLGSVVLAYFVLMAFISWQLGEDAKATWSAMMASELECPEGTAVTHRGWSKNGRMRYCEPVRNGPWEAWANGHRQIKGEYLAGQEHGTWYWFNPDGSVQQTIQYNAGKVVSQSEQQR